MVNKVLQAMVVVTFLTLPNLVFGEPWRDIEPREHTDNDRLLVSLLQQRGYTPRVMGNRSNRVVGFSDTDGLLFAIPSSPDGLGFCDVICVGAYPIRSDQDRVRAMHEVNRVNVQSHVKAILRNDGVDLNATFYASQQRDIVTLIDHMMDTLTSVATDLRSELQ